MKSVFGIYTSICPIIGHIIYYILALLGRWNFKTHSTNLPHSTSDIRKYNVKPTCIFLQSHCSGLAYFPRTELLPNTSTNPPNIFIYKTIQRTKNKQTNTNNNALKKYALSKMCYKAKKHPQLHFCLLPSSLFGIKLAMFTSFSHIALDLTELEFQIC